MKLALRLIIFALVLVIGSTVQAAAIYDYSYTFTGGYYGNGIVSGSFTGDANGNLITNLTNIFASYNGTPLAGSGNLFGSHYVDSSVGYSSGGAVASFDGLQNNFLFINSDYPKDQSYQAFFLDVSYSLQHAEVQQRIQGTSFINLAWKDDPLSSPYNASNWSVTAQRVPEPSAMLLFGSGLAGLGVLRKRFQ